MLLEGLHLAGAWLDGGAQPECCAVAQGALCNDEVRALLARVETARIVTLPDALFRPLSDVVHGVGLLLLVERPQPALPARIGQTCVILDGVQDAGNVGSILRSAAAAGVRQVFCTHGTASAWSPKVLRSAMGAHFLLQVFENVEAETLHNRLAVPVAITDSHGAAIIDECDLTGALAWVFGNEGSGVSPFWHEAATLRVTIPQPGGMESLNVAAAAAICLFEQGRQKRAR